MSSERTNTPLSTPTLSPIDIQHHSFATPSTVSTPTSYGPKPGNIRDYIIEAIAIAHQAVQEDTDNEPDLERASRLYREAAQRLEHIKPFAPDEHAKVLNKFVRNSHKLSR